MRRNDNLFRFGNWNSITWYEKWYFSRRKFSIWEEYLLNIRKFWNVSFPPLQGIRNCHVWKTLATLHARLASWQFSICIDTSKKLAAKKERKKGCILTGFISRIQVLFCYLFVQPRVAITREKYVVNKCMKSYRGLITKRGINNETTVPVGE